MQILGYIQNEIYFGSEIKFIKKIIPFKLKVNYELVRKYVSFGYRSLFQNNETFFSEINQLPPASYLEVNHNNQKITKKKYWDIKNPSKQRPCSSLS